MRITALLLACCVMYAQTGKPGVTDPIKDPQQIPGNPHPGPIPRQTPPPAASKPDQTRSRTAEKKKSKKQPKTEKEKVSPQVQ